MVTPGSRNLVAKSAIADSALAVLVAQRRDSAHRPAQDGGRCPAVQSGLQDPIALRLADTAGLSEQKRMEATS
jgi:hypothetical protein